MTRAHMIHALTLWDKKVMSDEWLPQRWQPEDIDAWQSSEFSPASQKTRIEEVFLECLASTTIDVSTVANATKSFGWGL
jgi:hypothetical protein